MSPYKQPSRVRSTEPDTPNPSKHLTQQAKPTQKSDPYDPNVNKRYFKNPALHLTRPGDPYAKITVVMVELAELYVRTKQPHWSNERQREFIHDILCEILPYRHTFDPLKAQMNTFVDHLIANKAINIALRAYTQKSGANQPHVSWEKLTQEIRCLLDQDAFSIWRRVNAFKYAELDQDDDPDDQSEKWSDCKNQRRELMERLTPKQREILELLQNNTKVDVARQMNITRWNVEWAIKKIAQELDELRSYLDLKPLGNKRPKVGRPKRINKITPNRGANQ